MFSHGRDKSICQIVISPGENKIEIERIQGFGCAKFAQFSKVQLCEICISLDDPSLDEHLNQLHSNKRYKPWSMQ